MKPIETIYKGYRFRSRLEARWAVFFDVLGMKWDYEKEGYDLGKLGWYLPDFWLPHSVEELAREGWGLWCEIKPLPTTDLELQKAIALALHTKHNVLIIQGSCGQGEYEITKISVVHHDPPEIIKNFQFAEIGGDRQAAFAAARAARFEHGESPAGAQ